MEKKGNPSVTILMAVYNGEKYLRQAIEGVLNQTYRDFEFLIINDGSTDRTEEIILSYSDDRIVYRAKQNEGTAKSLNFGLSLARGKYLRRHDADDLSEPDMLEIQMKFLKDHPHIHFVSTQCAFMTASGRIARRYRHPRQDLFDRMPYIFATLEQFQVSSPVEHGTVLGPTAIFREMGGYRPYFPVSEDHDLWLRIIEKYKFVVLNRCLYYHRLNQGSITVTYGSTRRFYRETALRFAQDRQQTGSDPLMRGEELPEPVSDQTSPHDRSSRDQGRFYRKDLLEYPFRIAWDAGDREEIYRILRYALKDGWRLTKTWKSILFTVIGPRAVRWGVAVKAIFS